MQAALVLIPSKTFSRGKIFRREGIYIYNVMTGDGVESAPRLCLSTFQGGLSVSFFCSSPKPTPHGILPPLRSLLSAVPARYGALGGRARGRFFASFLCPASFIFLSAARCFCRRGVGFFGALFGIGFWGFGARG